MELSPLSHVKQLEGHAKCIVDSLYRINFPIEARELMDEWIQTSLRKPESADLFTRPVEVIRGEKIGSFIQEFLETFAIKVESLPTGSRGSMNEVLMNLDKGNKENPLAFFKFLRHCIYMEQLLAGNALNGHYDPNWVDVGVFVERFNMLAENKDGYDRVICSLNEVLDSMTTLHSDLGKRNVYLDKLRRSSLPLNQRNEFETTIQRQQWQIEQEFVRKTPVLSGCRTELLQRIKYNVDQLAFLQDKVLEKLSYWKSQQERGPKESFNEGMDTMQLWCHKLAELNLECRVQLISVEAFDINILKLGIQPRVPAEAYLRDLRENLIQLLRTLVKLTFIVEIQPPGVIKTTNKFVVRLRSLVGGTKHLLTAPNDVKVSVVSEEVAKGIGREDTNFFARTNGKVSYNRTHVLYCDHRRQSLAEFRSLCVDKIQRQGGEEACRQKFCLKFETTFVVDGERFEVCTLSLPVTVAVNVSQEMNAWGPIIWDDIFRSSTRHPFQVKESTPWDSLAQALNRFFAKETGRHLTPDNLQFLREKFLTSHPQENPQNEFLVKFDTFFQDPISILVNHDPAFVFAKQDPVSTIAKGVLVPQEFSFWDWFYTVMKLTKGYLCDPWRKGLIEGFISKQQAAELLRGSPDNTFLLRFTESLIRGPAKVSKFWLGSVSVTWVETHTTSHKRLKSLQPFTATDLESRSLSEIISTCKIAKFLYPNIHSNSVFKPQDSATRIGYVPLIVTVDTPQKNSRESETQTEHNLGTLVPQMPLVDSSLPLMFSQFALGVEPGPAESIALPSFESEFEHVANGMQPTYFPSLNEFSAMEPFGSSNDQCDDSTLEKFVFACMADGESSDYTERMMEYQELH